MPVRTITEWSDLKAYEDGWNELLLENCPTIQGIDFTSSYDWIMSLLTTRKDYSEPQILAVTDQEKLKAVLPIYLEPGGTSLFRYRTVSPLSELYGGRSGIITGLSSNEYIRILLEHVFKKTDHWDKIKITLVSGSFSERSLLESVAAHGYRYVELSTQISPYIALGDDWDTYLKEMPKKLRWTMRNGEKRLREQGTVTHRKFCAKHEAAPFLKAVMEIENESWKQDAGTSISCNNEQELFYDEFTPRAGKNGWFAGHVLYLDDEPIAYIFGMVLGDIFSDLKESYKVKYRKMSPGHVLKSFVFKQLIENRINIYDFMGECEDYKMRWTKQTYKRKTYIIYNNSLKGRLLTFHSRLTSMLNGFFSGQKKSSS